MKKSRKVLLGAALLAGGLLLGLRFAGLPYAEGRLREAVQAAGLSGAMLERAGLGLHGLSYRLYPQPGALPMAELELDPAASVLGRRLVISSALLRLDEGWHVPGLAAAKGQTSAPLATLLERPIALPALPVDLRHAVVQTPLGPLELKGNLEGGMLQASWSFAGSAGSLGLTAGADGAYTLQGATSDGPYQVSLVVKGGRSAPVLTVQADIPAYTAGPLSLANLRFGLNAGDQPGYNLPYSLAATLNGQPAEIKGNIDLLRQTGTGSLTAGLKHDTLEATGITGRFELASLWPPVIKKGASVQAKAVQVGGLPLVAPSLTFGFANNRLELQSATAALLGGRVSVAPLTIALPLQKAGLSAEFTGLDLAQVLQLAAVDGLGGSGQLSGVVPVVYETGNIIVGPAQLTATQNGQIQYRPVQAPAFLAAGGSGEMLAQVFSDFRYSGLTVSLGGKLGDNLTLGARLEGRNPGFYNGHAVAFNLNLSGALESLLTKGLQSFQFSPEAIKQMSEEGSAP